MKKGEMSTRKERFGFTGASIEREKENTCGRERERNGGRD